MSDTPTPRPPSPSSLAGLEVEGLRLLLDVSRRINAVADSDAVLATVVDGLVSLVRADRGFLMLREADGSLRFAIARDRAGKPLEATKFKVSESVMHEVATQGITRLVDDAANNAALNARMSIVSLSLRTILCVPLKVDERIIGVIYVDSNAITRRFTSADVPLVEAFAAQAAATLERFRLQRIEQDSARMQQQLQVASEIQATFLPSRFPALSGVRGAVASVPALQVGGDFYDVLPLPRGRVGIMVGDVAGKGVPGALFSARLLSDIRYQALFHDDVSRTLEAVNAVVVERASRGMFVTLLYAVVDPATGEVTYGNAGHLAPLVRKAGGGLERWEGAGGPPLGVVAGMTYPAHVRRLARGEVLLLLSDGIADAVGASGERFGDERTQATITASGDDPAVVVRALCEATAAYTGQRPQADDQTLLAIALA
ncbi:MAG: PP2C family protein-serine/threonine phosphatase [Planctomycetia bacterium]